MTQDSWLALEILRKLRKMTPEQETVYVIKGAISELPAQARHDCETAAEEIRKIVRNAGDVGSMALALVGAEAAAQ